MVVSGFRQCCTLSKECHLRAFAGAGLRSLDLSRWRLKFGIINPPGEQA
jgi:hypothetical protein